MNCSMKVCMILDLEGFFVEKTFRCRELGYYTWQEKYGRYAFYMKTSWRNLSRRDIKTVSYVKYKVHGLTYQPRREEKAFEYYRVEDILRDLYEEVKYKDRTVVAYKGGHVERDLLNKLNIPCLNLEHYGCPKYDVLKDEFHNVLPSCGFHLNDKLHHCPIKECETFWLWLQNKNKQTFIAL